MSSHQPFTSPASHKADQDCEVSASPQTSDVSDVLPLLSTAPPALTVDPSVVGTPVLTLRWRLVNRTLIAASRHLKTLRARRFAPGLDSWCRQHIDWTLLEGAEALPDGVLVIEVDELGHAIMRIEPFEPLHNQGIEGLLQRAAQHAPVLNPVDKTLPLAQRLTAEGARMATGDSVAAEVLWLIDSAQQRAVLLTTADHELSGINGLVCDLLMTKGVACERQGVNLTDKHGLSDAHTLMLQMLNQGGDVLLVSDEFGVVCADECGEPSALAAEVGTMYQRLVEMTSKKRTHARLAWRPAQRG